MLIEPFGDVIQRSFLKIPEIRAVGCIAEYSAVEIGVKGCKGIFEHRQYNQGTMLF